MRLSTKGAVFISEHEGTVLRAYRDPVNVMTIGIGFTSQSKVFSEYWLKKTGSRKIKKGQRITKEECIMLLQTMVDNEYGRAVTASLGVLKQHQYDSSSSMTYNCGPRCLQWNWADALKRGKVKESAQLLRQTAVTAKGKKLPGLVRRRRDEAHLLETGSYGHATKAVWGKIEIKEYQGLLAQLGYYNDSIDGIAGPKTKTAVFAFQRSHPQLDNDGIVGPATLSALRRAVNARTAQKRAASGSVGAAGGSVAGSYGADQTGFLDLPWQSIGIGGAIVAILVIGGITAWRYRDEIEHKFKEVTS